MPFLAHLHDFIASYGYFAVFVIVGLESAGVPMPGDRLHTSVALDFNADHNFDALPDLLAPEP